MKDINLNDTGYGYYDTQFKDGDLDIVNGVASVENGIIQAILTRYNELKQLPSYTGFGSRVHDYIKDNGSNLNRFKIRSAIKESIEAMNRVASVESVTLEETREGYYVTVECTSADGSRINMEANL
jgi:hypothetical protein